MASGGVEVIADGNALGVGGVPHAPLVRLAGIGRGVEEEALLAAGRVAFAEPFASGVGGTGGGGAVLVASLAAGAARSIPVAEPFGVARNVDGDGGAGLFADVSARIEHALCVGRTSDGVVDVLDVAAGLALLADLVVGAHGRKILAVDHVQERASFLALTGDGVELAVSVGIAAVDGVAARFASFAASVGGGVEDA